MTIRKSTDTRPVVFELRNGDRIHALLVQDTNGATRLNLYCNNGNLLVSPMDSRAVFITTQTQLVGLERSRPE